MVKESISSMMKMSLQNIYLVCSKKCIKDYKNNDLSDREKICLSRCFERKNETLQLTLEYLGKLTEAS
jgi:import inner membrane translocase subunit TIM10